MRLNELKPPKGAKKKRKRVGRGEGSGHGGTSCRGHKGQNARSGGGVPPWFEGGQMPLQRRLPKRGFRNPFRLKIVEVNVRELKRFEPGSVVDAQALRAAGVIKGQFDAVKLLGVGEVDRPLTVRVQRASRSAIEKVEAAGGKVELI